MFGRMERRFCNENVVESEWRNECEDGRRESVLDDEFDDSY